MFARGSLFHRRSSTFSRVVGLAAITAATLGLAACGSSAKASSSPSAPTTAPAGTAAPTAHAVVMTAQNPKLGAIVVDTQGRTLYTLTNGGKPVACTGMCTQFWPPLLLPSGATTPTGTNVSGLTVVAMNGGEQVAYHGDPLYRYSGDSAAGDTNGQGINSFGGTWHAASTASASASAPAGAPAATTPQTMPPATSAPSSSGGGYGGGGY